MLRRTATLLLACTSLSIPAPAKSDDASYCAELGRLALRYTGGAGAEGRLAADFATVGAIQDCNRGNFAAGIPVLERKLRSNGFTLPRR